jgi:hypothetical protein
LSFEVRNCEEIINKLETQLEEVNFEHERVQTTKKIERNRITSENLTNLISHNPLSAKQQPDQISDLPLSQKSKGFIKRMEKLSSIFNKGLRSYYAEFKRDLKNLHRCRGIIDQDDCGKHLMSNFQVLWRAFYDETKSLINKCQFHGFFTQKKFSNKLVQVNSPTHPENPEKKINPDFENLSQSTQAYDLVHKRYAKERLGGRLGGVSKDFDIDIGVKGDGKGEKGEKSIGKSGYRRRMLFDDSEEYVEMVNLC